jgi:flagellin
MSVLNSVHTNEGAMVALQSLNSTNTQLQAAQKQVSTGYRVADAFDDGATFAVAQKLRSDVGALTTANQQLGNVSGLVQTTVSGLTQISNLMNNMRDVLTNLASGNVQGDQRSAANVQYQQDMASIKSFVQDSVYDGSSLIKDIGGTAGMGAVNVIRNEVGSTYSIGTFSGSALYAALTLSTTATATAVAALLTASGSFIQQLASVNKQLNIYGAANTYVTNQISFNSSKIDALNSGLGAMVDANLAQESATLQSLQIQQQLGQQALSMANQAPQSLLSLFR